MHWFMHARRGVLLFTSRFNSPIAAAPHDIRRKISMHVRNAAPVMQTHGPAHDRQRFSPIRQPLLHRERAEESLRGSGDKRHRPATSRMFLSPAPHASRTTIGSDTAERCGFLDSAYFARVFRKIVGCSPNHPLRGSFQWSILENFTHFRTVCVCDRAPRASRALVASRAIRSWAKGPNRATIVPRGCELWGKLRSWRSWRLWRSASGTVSPRYKGFQGAAEARSRLWITDLAETFSYR
jgi:AraC-like DNA-binding protein